MTKPDELNVRFFESLQPLERLLRLGLRIDGIFLLTMI